MYRTYLEKEEGTPTLNSRKYCVGEVKDASLGDEWFKSEEGNDRGWNDWQRLLLNESNKCSSLDP